MATVRAVYEHGVLRLLDPVQLSEGQEVKLTILPTGDSVELTPEEIDRRLKAAGMLGDERWFSDDEVEALLPQERDRIGRLFLGNRSIDELIAEDRSAR